MDSTNLSYDSSFSMQNVRQPTPPSLPTGYFDNTAWPSSAGLSNISLPFGTYAQNKDCFFVFDNGDGMAWNSRYQDVESECNSAHANSIPTPPLSSTHIPPRNVHGTYSMAPMPTSPGANTSEQPFSEYHHAVPEQTRPPTKSTHSKVSKSKGKGKGKSAASAKPRSLSEGELIAFSPVSSTSASRRTLRTANRKRDDSNEELSPGVSPPGTERSAETPEHQEKVARAKHNDVEREYRNRLNLQYRMLIDTLDESAPQMDGRREKDLSKAEVLELARQRIRTLGDEIMKSSDENRLLREQVATLLNAIQHS